MQTTKKIAAILIIILLVIGISILLLQHCKQTVPQICKADKPTHEAMKIVVRWQQWLAERGATTSISEEGFTSHNKSLEALFCEGPCQILIMYIDNQEVDVLCFPDNSTAQETYREVIHTCMCMDMLPGMICYESFGVYENFVIMLPVNESSEKIERFITGFWDKNFNRTIV